MRKTSKTGLYISSVLGLSLIIGMLLHAGAVSSGLRLAINIANLYGAVILVGSLTERLWQAALSVSKGRNVNHPQAAAAVSLTFVLVLFTLLFSLVSSTPAGRVAVSTIFKIFILVAGSIVIGKWLAAIWDFGSNLIHSRKHAAHRGAI